MVKVLLVLLYLFQGQVVVEQKPAESVEQCEAMGEKRVRELVKDPKFDGGLYAGCVPVAPGAYRMAR